MLRWLVLALSILSLAASGASASVRHCGAMQKKTEVAAPMEHCADMAAMDHSAPAEAPSDEAPASVDCCCPALFVAIPPALATTTTRPDFTLPKDSFRPAFATAVDTLPDPPPPRA